MLEKQLSINFFLKPTREKSDLRGVYLRITVDGIRKEISLSHKWDIKRWNQKAGRANGAKEDAKTLNYLLDTIVSKITKYKLELLSNEEPITASVLMDYIQGKGTSKAKVLEEFQKHNDEVFKLVPKEYAIGTHERYVTARSHVAEYIRYVYGKEDTNEKLSTVRDVFVFQCYTGLAYIDVFQLKKSDITKDEEGNLWIRTNRQKTDANITIPLLPKAIEIMEKHKDHPACIGKDVVLPVRSNQKMNEYLKEIASLCEISELNTHKARRTFGSTVTLGNGVPIHVVKEMLGHHSVKQTEEYALTEEESIKTEMQILKGKLEEKANKPTDSFTDLLESLKNLNPDKLAQLTTFINQLNG